MMRTGKFVALAIALSIQGPALADPPTYYPATPRDTIPEVPYSETKQETELFGRVTDSKGVYIPGATVTIEGPRQPSKSTVTGGRGEFKFRDLQPGRYKVVAAVDGMSLVSATVDVAPERTTSLTLALTGPVPVAEPRRLSPSASPSPQPELSSVQEVLEKELADELAAQAWVNDLSTKGKRIVAIVSLGPARSLFVVQREKAAPHYTVIRADRTLDAANLSKLLDAYGVRTLVGVHALDKAFLMIFSS